jgi:DNA modification methylase
MAFADPPDNIGLGYDRYEDRLDSEEYVLFLYKVIKRGIEADVFWLSFNSRWTLDVAQLAANLENVTIRPCVQVFTFGQQGKSDLTNCYRPLWRFTRPEAVLYPDAIKVPSWRQQNGDKRAAPGGKVPSDVWEYPRVTGNSKQRRSWHPTQLHEGLYERCLRFSCKEGDTAVDMFAGTGTMARVAPRLKVNAVLMELDPMYCEHIADEHGMSKVTEGIWCNEGL